MGSLLMYRGLPGGPTKIKFADELPRHCLCGCCGMITLSMYQDPNEHMFCEACLDERSTKYGVYHIFCDYERRNIGIHEMFEARDLIMILRDQYVECPNKPHCKECMPLENLHEHYVACKKRVQCSSCGESIETEKWNDHRCPLETERAVTKATEKIGALMKAVKGRECQGNQKRLVLHSPQTHDYKPSASRGRGDNQSTKCSTTPSETLGRTVAAVLRTVQQVTSEARGIAPSVQNSEGENRGPEATQLCKYCQRKVKEINMLRHQDNCSRAPKHCVYCDKKILREIMQMHIQECDQNPDNVPEFNSKAPEQGANTEPPETNHDEEAVVNTNRDLIIGDGPIWLQYLALGDWLGAFVIMEESFRCAMLEQEEKYALLAPALVGLQLYDCVEDFLAKPCLVQPYDCLLAALLVRKYLPQKVWSKKKQELTWKDAQQYMPYFLASRLSDKAIAYLGAFPVFLDEVSSQEVSEDSACVAPRQPSSKPGPNGVSEEPCSGKAHGGVKTTAMDASKSDFREEAPASAESGRRGQGKRQARSRRKGKKRRR